MIKLLLTRVAMVARVCAIGGCAAGVVLMLIACHPSKPLQLHACNTRLATQPLLAGIKHCNRLEQVLA